MFPVLDDGLKQRMIEEVLGTCARRSPRLAAPRLNHERLSERDGRASQPAS